MDLQEMEWKAWAELVWLRKRTDNVRFRMGYSTFGLHITRGISLTQNPLVSQEELCYTKLVNVACVGIFFRRFGTAYRSRPRYLK